MPAGRIILEGVVGPIRGLHWESTQLLRIGRNQNLDVVLSDPSIGLVHAEIRTTHRGWTVHDLGSPAGTLVNGLPVDAAGRKLHKNDLLQCGRLALKVNELEMEQLPPASILPPSKDIRATGAMLRIQASSQLSWEKGLDQPNLEGDNLAPARHFLKLLSAGYYLGRIDSLPELLQTLLDDTVAVLDAQRGAIVMVDPATGTLTLKNVSGPKSVGAKRCFSKTLAERCFAKGESLLCVEASLAGSTSSIRGDMASVICGLLRSPRRRLGVLHVDRGPLQEPFSNSDLRIVDSIAATVSVGIESAIAVEKQRNGFVEEATGLALRAIEARDPETAAHSQRVSIYADHLGQEIGLSSEDTRMLHLGALLHDLGNVGIEDVVLKKREHLSTAEATILQTHVQKGVTIAEGLSGLGPLLPIIRHHHEHWDGTGYPDGLKGEAIPRLARLVAVADMLDELIADATKQIATSPSQTFDKLQQEAGRKLDPQAVAAAVRIQTKLQGL